MDKNPGMFSSKTLISFSTEEKKKKNMDVLDEMGVSKLSVKKIFLNQLLKYLMSML